MVRLKKWFLFFAVIGFSFAAHSQVDTTTPPYKRFPKVPPFKILLSDSATYYTKAELPAKLPVFLMLFSPECSHCQHTAEELLKYKDEFKDIQIVLATLHPLWMMNEFVEKYKLKEMAHLVVGKDVFYILPNFYSIKSLPYMAMYSKKGDLLYTFEGSLPISKVLQVFKESK